MNQTEGLLILGAGGHGRVVAEAAFLTGCWKHIGFLDDNVRAVPDFPEISVCGCIEDSSRLNCRFSHALVAIGENRLRLEWQRRLSQQGYQIATLVHPWSQVSSRASLGAGTVVLAGAVVNPGASVGEASILNTSVVVEHDCRLGRAVHISPGATLAGNVSVGDYSWIGAGAVVLPGVVIENEVVVGAGAVVLQRIASGLTVAGVPARKLKIKKQ